MTGVKLSAEELKHIKRDVLKDQLSYLCEELGDPGRYFPFLKSKDVLSQAESEAIRSKTTTQESVEEFVRVIGDSRESKKGEPVFDVFVDALKRQKVQAHIARALQRTFARKKAEKEKEKRAACQQEGDATMAQHTSGSQPDLQTAGLQTPIQATSRSRSSTPNPDTNHIGSQVDTPVTTNGFEYHPEHGALPNVPKHIEEKMEARKQGSPPPLGDHVHPTYGPLPPTLPPSNSLQESDSTLPDQYETGLSNHLPKSPQLVLYTPENGGTPSLTSEVVDGAPSPQTEQKYRANLRQQIIPSHHRKFSDEGEMNGTLEHMLERQNYELKGEVEYLNMFVAQKEAEIESLCTEKKRAEREVMDLKMENKQLKRQLEDVKDYDGLQKELQQVKEKLHHVTLSYHEHSYESIRRSSSDLDDYAQLQEESSKLTKELEEYKSRIDSIERERGELKSQVDEYQRCNQALEHRVHTLQLNSSMQTRPHNLPINHMMGATQHPSYVGETPASFTPPRSLHAGDHLSRHNIHLQHSGVPGDKRHSASSGELTPGADTTSLRSSNTSLSSHGSKTSLQLNHSASSTTLV